MLPSRLKRIDIRAPQTGTVHELSVHTVGGVVPAGEQLMLIVPDADLLVVEAKVQPQDVDQLFVGQPAGLRFTAFSQRTTPEVNGTVQQISADVTTDTRTGLSHYTVRVAITPAEVGRLGAIKLVPGMPVETSTRGLATGASRPVSSANDRSGKARVPRRLTNEVLEHARAYAPSNALAIGMAFVCQGRNKALGALPLGLVKISRDVPVSTITPASSTITSLAILDANRRSCVAMTIVVPSRANCASTSTTSPESSGSSADVGSSQEGL